MIFHEDMKTLNISIILLRNMHCKESGQLSFFWALRLNSCISANYHPITKIHKSTESLFIQLSDSQYWHFKLDLQSMVTSEPIWMQVDPFNSCQITRNTCILGHKMTDLHLNLFCVERSLRLCCFWTMLTEISNPIVNKAWHSPEVVTAASG